MIRMPQRAAHVIDGSRRNQLPTGRVRLAVAGDYTDRELADLAGFSSRCFGYGVTRYPDTGTVEVQLWND